MVDLQQEKLESMALDTLHENKMRTDYEYAIANVDENCSLEDAVKTIREISIVLNSYGWETTPQELLDLA